MRGLCQKWLLIIAFYDPKRKIILKYGSSRPCGHNHSKKSIHCEDIAINYCRNIDKKLNIYIWKYNVNGEIKPAYCCYRCTLLANKYNYTNKIYTFNNNEIISGIVDNPVLSLGYIMNN